MKLYYTTLIFFLSAYSALAQIYTGPIPKPSSGYGADGSNTVAVERYANPNYPTEDIRIYYPSGISSPVPTIFYSHGFGGYDPLNITGLLNFVAKKGYAIVFVPYQTNGVTSQQRYTNLLNGFMKSARDFPNIIDTTKVGFMGHSFGGGASFANSHHCFTKLNWGSSARFIFASAQWYSLNISQAELLSFPNDVKLITMVYENDITNDHRMANDIFRTINIPASEKDYLLVKSDTIGNYTYDAIHGVPNTLSSFDALDYYALYRHLDALCDYTFNGSVAGKDVALGNGSANQIFMPTGMRKLVHSDNPTYAIIDTSYTYPCDANQNPRQNYCTTTSVNEVSKNNNVLGLNPNPASTELHIRSDFDIASIELLNELGQSLLITNSKTITITELPRGLYFVKVKFVGGREVVEKVVKE